MKDMQTTINNTVIESDVVYPDLISNKRQFKKVRIVSDEELKTLIGSLDIGNKYLVIVANKILYRHDAKVFECESTSVISA